MPVRPNPFDSDEPTPKRQKIVVGETLPIDISDDELSSSPPEESLVATIPLSPAPSSTVPTQPVRNAVLTSSPPGTYQTQPTQVVDLTELPQLIVQVEASSPIQQTTPSKSSNRQLQINGGEPIKPFSFYSSQQQNAGGRFLGFASDDGPQYIGSSSDGESDHDIVPDFASQQTPRPKVPSVRELKARREMSANHPANIVTRVEESPDIKTALSKFVYKPPERRRLDSLKTPIGGGLAAIYSRPRSAPQMKPSKAQPIIDLTLDDIKDDETKKKVDRMQRILPSKSIKSLIAALEKTKGNFDDAMDFATADETIDITLDAVSVAMDKTSKRDTRAPRQAIKDKWSSTQAQARLPSHSPQAKPRRKLVRGSKTGSVGASLPSSPAAIDVDSDDDSSHDSDQVDEGYEQELEAKVLGLINTCEIKSLMDLACTTQEIAEAVLAQRPYKTIEQVRAVSLDEPARRVKGKRGGKQKAVGNKLVDVCVETFRGYEAVDVLIQKCEELGRPLTEAIRSWGVDTLSKTASGELEIVNINVDSGIGTPDDEDGGEDILIRDRRRGESTGKFMRHQPKNLASNVLLKDYQIVGLNWLNMLYERSLSCILADEMGLGKTCQVVSFLAYLLSKGEKGPHLVVVPASTLENWLREFKRFCPSLFVEPYYGTQKERAEARYVLTTNPGFNVLVTTYNIATGDKMDKKFLRNLNFNVCVYDEGHMLKNSSSSRYTSLMQLPAKFRLLLTGTPLQNNLQELASLLAFILPTLFNSKKDELTSIFKYRAKTTDEGDASSSALLSQTRIERAKKMMTPFVLRRKKQQVLGKHLPEKTTRVEYCEMHEAQKVIYDKEIAAAQAALEERALGKKSSKTTNNTLMQLRKAAIHPFLFREHFNDDICQKMSTAILKEPEYEGKESLYIYEDMCVMNDFELNRLCMMYPKTLGKWAFRRDEWMEAGKVEKLKELLIQMRSNGDRVLVFSQFTQVLDILEKVMSTLDTTFLRLDGSTRVEDRQNMIDQFHDEEDITAFLLSTKAGGFGINLACANKVIIFDSSFNPHDDRQAADRAHRVGQTRPVEVINLVTKGTIEEAILALANTKLALDQSISEDTGVEAAIESKAEEMVARMMLGGKI